MGILIIRVQVLTAKDRLEWRFPSLFSQEKQKYDNKGMLISTYEQNMRYVKWKLCLEVSEVPNIILRSCSS